MLTPITALSLLAVGQVAPSALPMIGRPPQPAPVIAEGPLDVMVTHWDEKANRRSEKPVRGMLFLVTEKAVIYHRADDLGRAVICEREYVGAKSQRVESRTPAFMVEGTSADGRKLLWLWNSTQKKFAGPGYKPEFAGGTPRSATKGDEARHLYFAFGRLADRLDAALRAGDAAEVAACRRRSEQVAAHVTGASLSAPLGALYRQLGPDADEYFAVKREMADLFERSEREAVRLKREAAYAASKAAAANFAGMMQAMLGATPKLVGVIKGDEIHFENRMSDPEAVLAGMDKVMRANLELAQERLRLARAKDVFERQAAEEYAALSGRAKAVRGKRTAKKP